ncbi:MAG TPA: DUF1579 domain-containing protein [Chitinophagaceae bacterium]
MRKIFFTALAFTAFVACRNEDKAKTSEAATSMVQPEKVMTKAEQDKAWMEYMTPGSAHELMARSNGTWEADITMWMHPDSPAVKTKGVAVYRSILGGRYQEGVHTGDMMGMPFEGRSILAFDNAKKVWLSSWIDNMGTGMMNMEGNYDEGTKTLSTKGKMVDPTTGKDCDVRETVTWLDDNTQKMEMYCNMHGREFKTMELTARRKK